VTAPSPDASEPFAADNGASGVLVLHGFTGTPRSMRALADALDRAGFSVELPLLPGHGTNVEDLAGRRYAEWMAAAETAYARLAARGGTVVVCGLSMGGTLALDLALGHPETGGLVLINPMVAPPAPSLFSLLRAALEGGTVTIPSIGSDIAKPGQSGGGYAATPIAPMISIFEATEILAPRLSEIACPAVLFSSRTDHVVPSESSDLVEREYGGPLERITLERSYHVATLDYDADAIESGAVAFAEKVTSG
jgi:carboxylesterase